MVALVSMHSPEFKELAALTGANKKEYCEKHNFIWHDEEVGSYFSSFIKFTIIKKMLNDNPAIEWVWFTGADSLITDFTNDLSTIVGGEKRPLLIATDRNGINADSFLVRNSVEGQWLLNWFLFNENLFDSEQAAIVAVSEQMPLLINILPQRIINSYNYDLYGYPRLDKLGTDGHWQYGDLLIHWPGFTDNIEMRISFVNEWLPQIKY